MADTDKSQTTYEVTLTQVVDDDGVPTEDDIRSALIEGLVRRGWRSLVGVAVENKN